MHPRTQVLDPSDDGVYSVTREVFRKAVATNQIKNSKNDIEKERKNEKKRFQCVPVKQQI